MRNRRKQIATLANRFAVRHTVESLEPRNLLAANPIITEFMASNSETLLDGNGDSPDWIELYNAGDEAVDLAGYRLTDDPMNLARWTFPSVALEPGSYLVVFASGQETDDFRDVDGNLHTNFKLGRDGEYLALVDPSGAIATQFGSATGQYPAQVTDVSFGISQARDLLTDNDPAHYWIPFNDDLGLSWTEPDFDPASSGFTEGTAALGYEDNPTNRTNFVGHFQTELPSNTHAAYVRAEFDVENAAEVVGLNMNLKFDNGFVAYINGVKVASENAPDVLGWFSTAPDNSPRDSAAIQFAEFDLADHVDSLVDGKNVLAIHLLNNQARDRSDMLLAMRLTAAISSVELPVGYLLTPTPGAANISPESVTGPIIHDATSGSAAVADDQDILVTARFSDLNAPFQSASLVYRVMFGPEVFVPMVDDGTGSDATAGDGVYSGLIPHAASNPGEMIRWSVQAADTQGNTSRAPHYLDRVGQSQSIEYHGSVVISQIDTKLPVIQWFVENPREAETGQGTRSSLFFNDQFYDNVFWRIRGGTARNWPKKAYKVEFNDDQLFQYRPNGPIVDEINLNTTYTDKSYVRAILTAELHLDSGTPAPETFHMRLHQNGEFFSVALLTEQPDRYFLAHHGLDESGSLYKGGPGSTLQRRSGLEKKTRDNEDNSDILALIDGLKLEGAELENYLFDNIDLPAQINYMAGIVVTQNIDASDKNYFIYRDTEGSGEWQMTPWDLDLTFGPDALNTNTILADENRAPGTRNPNAVHPFLGSRAVTLDGASKFNELEDRIINNPRTQEMFLRRIRSLVDEYLATDYFTKRIDELTALIAPDVELDRETWGARAHFGGATLSLLEENERIKNEYLIPRLPYLTTRQSELTFRQGGVGIPDAQVENSLIAFGDIEFNPASGNQDEQFIQLVNTNPWAVDVSGWKLTGSVEHTLKPGTVIPSGESLYVTPNVRSFRARTDGPRGGQALFVQGNYEGRLSGQGETLTLQTSDGTPVARTQVGGEPSELQTFLRISEINFQPHAANPIEGLGEVDDGTANAAERFEFIELINTGEVVLELDGAQFTNGVEFTFPTGTTLNPGDYVLIAKDETAFESRYGSGLNIAGQFEGTLDDSGEHLFLDDATGRTIHSFAYRTAADWPVRALGLGSSLQVLDTLGNYSEPANWHASTSFGGSPGRADLPSYDEAVISELLANSSSPNGDQIELFNTGGTDVDVSGWYLSNSNDDYFKYRIPAGTVLPSNGYVSLPQSQFEFDFDGIRGGQAWLVAGDSSGKPLGFVDHIQFTTSLPDTSLGPWPEVDDPWIMLDESTFGSANVGPHVSPVVISEIHYTPIDPDGKRRQEAESFQFIELHNHTDQDADVGDWRLSGDVEYVLPTGTSIPAGQILTVVTFDSSDPRQSNVFKFSVGMDLTAPIAGPFEPVLDADGALIQLLRPVPPPADEPNLEALAVVDQVDYLNEAPWPEVVPMSGNSLTRNVPDAYGPLPSNWSAAAASPGEFTPMARRRPGDANADGLFDQKDIVAVLQAGKYLTGAPASFAEGDWDGDGLFDQKDIVTALQSGGYLQGLLAVLGVKHSENVSVQPIDDVFAELDDDSIQVFLI